MLQRIHQIQFLQQTVQVIRKPRARRLSLSIKPGRLLKVTSNISTTDAEIYSFLENQVHWIKKQLDKIEKQNEFIQKPEFKEASFFPFLGEFKYFKFAQTTLKNIFFQIEDGFLIAYLPQGWLPDLIKSEELLLPLQKFYKEKSEAYLKERLNHLTELTCLKPSVLQFNRAQTRWGSCNSRKKIILNWKLICFSKPMIDYVIVHELCHLKFLNHSPDFWNLVESFMPEYKTYEKILKEQAALCTFLDKMSHF